VVFLDDALPDADAVLFLTDAGTALTAPELELLRAVSASGSPVLLAVTGIDRYPGWHDVLASDLACLRGLGLLVEPFAV
jgi:predicted GTPase